MEVAQRIAHEGLVEDGTVVQRVDEAVALVELSHEAARAEAHHQPVADAHLAEWLADAAQLRVHERVAVSARAAPDLLHPARVKVADRHARRGGGVVQVDPHRSNVRE